MERYRDIIPDFDAFRERLQEPQPYDFRVNTLKTDVATVRAWLDEHGYDADQLDWNERFFRADFEPGRTMLQWLGKIYVQESVSGIPPLALAPGPEDRVLDLCAAPGSKTTQLAAMMDNRGEIVANDPSTNRVRALIANCYRTGTVNVQTTQSDGRDLEAGEPFDRVLVDAPCSAEGNARTQEDLRDGASQHDIESVAELQQQLLEAAIDRCREGGTIVYSTCTFAPEENEQVVASVLDRVDVEPLSFDFPHSDGVTSWNGEELETQLKGCVRVYPHQLDSGGIFVARLAK